MGKFIVTGGLGFIGSNLIEFLLNKGHFVINIDKISYASNFYNTNKFQNDKNYRFYKSDIGNKKKLIFLIKKYKPICIFNLAAETHVDRSIDNSESFIKSNINSVQFLLDVLVKYKKTKLIHISTDEVYGNIKGNLRANENFPYNPQNPYAATKASSDHLIRSYINTFKINAIITNCCNNYGPRQNPEKLIPKMIFNLLNGQNLPIYAKGKNSREWIYVLDHCKALYRVFQKGKIGETYNIGSNNNLRNIDLVKKIISIYKNKKKLRLNSKIQYVKDRPGHDLRYALNSKKINTKLKWRNEIDIEQGLLMTLDWYQNNKKFINRLGTRI